VPPAPEVIHQPPPSGGSSACPAPEVVGAQRSEAPQADGEVDGWEAEGPSRSPTPQLIGQPLVAHSRSTGPDENPNLISSSASQQFPSSGKSPCNLRRPDEPILSELVGQPVNATCPSPSPHSRSTGPNENPNLVSL
jgi:hypothetical protein